MNQPYKNMDRLKMQSKDQANFNYNKLVELFPNAVTETVDENGEIVRAIDKDILMQEISTQVVEGREERYQFTWPDKRKAILAANGSITKTLRPCREESVDYNKTENLYIEGDNLEVLKVLRETYLGKVKMIYIDPPYNTGNDFVYNDTFSQTKSDFEENSGLYDDNGNQILNPLQRNAESNGRFHTDWLNMMYPRLKVARDLLSDDGAIFISIDDNEVENLRKVCDEIYGENNCICQFVWKNKYGAGGGTNSVAYVHEYILAYSKNIIESITCELSEELRSAYNKTDDKFSQRGGYTTQPLASTSKGERKNLMYEIHHNGEIITPPKGGRWIWSKEKFDAAYANNEIVINKTATGHSVRFKQYLKDVDGNIRKGTQLSMITNVFNQEGSKEFAVLMKDKRIFDFPKPVNLIKSLLKLNINGNEANNDIILDFFSGSSSTAHAIMQLNAEDGGHRKFIMVQLPEVTDENSEANKAGFKNICEIGKERIRRAGKLIKDEFKDKDYIENLDTGFRVLKLDSSNLQQTWYTPNEYVAKDLFESTTNNIKPDRNEEDLLYQVMLELDCPLSSKIESKNINGKNVFVVADGYISACFGSNITEEIITEIAKLHTNYFVMRDSSMANDSVAVNFEQIFKSYSPETQLKVF